MASNAHTFAQPSPESTDLSELEKARQGSGNGQDHDHDDDSASTASDSTFSERHMKGPQSLRGVPTTLSRTTSRRLEQTGTATSTALSRIRSRPARQSFTHPLANEKTNQDVLVDFDGPDDPYRPLNWPFRKKAITTVLYGFTTMGATFASSVYSPALEQVSSDFGVGREVSVLGLALLLFGFGLGPLVWAPLSEVYGRKPAVLIPTFVSAIFAFGGGAAKDIQTILICRFFQGLFGSAPVTNTGGVLGDIWSAEQRGAAIVGYAMAVVGGPTLGPIVGGAICMSYLRWRWTQYITGIFQMFILVLDIIVLDESYPAALLVSKAQRLRHQTGNWALHAKHEEWDVSLNELANKYLVRPFQLLMTPICFLVALYASFVYGILYASLAAFPIEFEEARGWNKVVGALPFLAMLLGVIIGAGANLFNQKFYIKRWKANNCRPVPEARLPPMMAGSLFFVAGLFMFAWTSSPSIHWIAPCIGIVLLGCGFFTIFQAALNYLIDTFQRYAASAVAANTFLRSAFAGAFPIFIAPMLHNIGIDWGISVFAFVACLLVPIPYLFYIYDRRRESVDMPGNCLLFF
ncbi:MFS general substrate transporter [Hortaea werneckii]|nr:MFS general substrate transporter [Hortaea werneckii]KAI7064429.1 MFS general substrate transporter [Hortaea werneckii]KAI7215389.1 MFS general substrate transporter [Hortaea werneckii]KAI7325283.1 MFS general substrate transporter [Hortaea werneckii]KAI7403302.1 MFS general substrate transporter [Hortaea werneckii]